MVAGEVLGYVAAFLTTVAFIPQALHTVKTRNTEAISLGMYSTFTLGVVCWFGYGVYRQDIAIMIANIIIRYNATNRQNPEESPWRDVRPNKEYRQEPQELACPALRSSADKQYRLGAGTDTSAAAFS